MEKLKNLNVKKLIKIITTTIGFILIVFMSFFDAIFDFLHFDWFRWLANSSILVGIMIFGLLMGNSIGSDNQKEKVKYNEKGELVGGRYQVACNQYNEIRLEIECIKYYFSQFWLWFKQRKLFEKKVDYLLDNQFDTRVASIIVKNIEKDDLEIGKLQLDPTKPHEKIYVKNGIKIKKLNEQEIEILKGLFEIKLDTFGETYYLHLFDNGENKTNEAEIGKKIAYKIKRDKRVGMILKITSSLIISIVWSALTIKEFTDGGDVSARQRAWLNLLSRLTALITSFVSGYSTSVVNVKDQALAIDNKVSILKEFKNCYENKIFIPETYEEMIERELKEQQEIEQKELALESDIS